MKVRKSSVDRLTSLFLSCEHVQKINYRQWVNLYSPWCAFFHIHADVADTGNLATEARIEVSQTVRH